MHKSCAAFVFLMLPWLSQGANFALLQLFKDPACTKPAIGVDPGHDFPALLDTCVAYYLGAGPGSPNNFYRKWTCDSTRIKATCYTDAECTVKKPNCDVEEDEPLKCTFDGDFYHKYTCSNNFSAAIVSRYLGPRCTGQFHTGNRALPVGLCYEDYRTAGTQMQKNECVNGQLVESRYAYGSTTCDGSHKTVATINTICDQPGSGYNEGAKVTLYAGCGVTPGRATAARTLFGVVLSMAITLTRFAQAA